MPERDCLKEAARVALNTCEGHLDYLSSPNITWSLVNDDFTVEEKQVLVIALLARLEWRVLDLPPNKPVYPCPALGSGMTGSGQLTTASLPWTNVCPCLQYPAEH